MDQLKSATPGPNLSKESEFAGISNSLKQSQINAKTKINLEKFFQRHNKAQQNLKEQEKAKKFELEDKREKYALKMSDVNSNKKNYLEKILEHQRSRVQRNYLLSSDNISHVRPFSFPCSFKLF